MTKIDQRLAALYNEYCKAGKEEEFISMLYALLDKATTEIVERVAKEHRYSKMKATRVANKDMKRRFEAYLAAMSPEERIEFLNRPWNEQPEWIKENITDLVKYPEQFNFLRVAEIVNESERQKETFGARLVRYMETHGFITSDEEGTKLHYENFSAVCNKLAEKYDLERRPGRKAQKTRISTSDLKGYTSKNITPKKDKLTVISAATGIPIAYFGGYLDNDPMNLNPDPNSNGPFRPVTRFRKRRTSKGDAA